MGERGEIGVYIGCAVLGVPNKANGLGDAQCQRIRERVGAKLNVFLWSQWCECVSAMFGFG